MTKRDFFYLFVGWLMGTVGAAWNIYMRDPQEIKKWFRGWRHG